MKTALNNPSKNKLPDGIKEQQIIDAIEGSGYPLQGLVASKLKDRFSITEEWGYIDRNTEEHRSLDVFAYRAFIEDRTASVRPSLVLLIECKRSRNSYIFFKNVTDRPMPSFPAVAGLHDGKVYLYNKDGAMLVVAGATALGIDKHFFVEPGPPKCAAFSQAKPNGKKVHLSGAEPFNSIVLPLVNAINHTYHVYEPTIDSVHAKNLFPTLIFCISVLDAPMILVESPEQSSDPVLTPWVHIIRQEANSFPRSGERFRFYAIDAVHIDFFDEFVNTILIPFAEEFSRRAIQLGEVLVHGGEVEDLKKWEWDEIHKRSK